MDKITIPDLDDPRVLRHVRIDGYRLLTWDCERQGFHVGRFGKDIVGYAVFRDGEAAPIFLGEDFGCAPGNAIDSDAALRMLLGFLTLRPGDTDDEYFADYTERQHAFAASDAEHLSIWGHEDTEPDNPLPDFEEV